ncbi:methyltransferase domain-containing protein [Enterococcus sp. N249-2]
MLKKIDRGRLFLQAHQALFACPICQQRFFAADSGLVCANRHRFDLSKKGTLFFLDHAVKTEYDQSMFLPRQRMIQSGMYQPVLALIKKHLSLGDSVLDVGCGEGSFLNQLISAPTQTAVGFDIAKEGISLATNQAVPAFWCVADLTNLPFAAASFDTVLNIFSPSNYEEFNRILKKGGQLIKVVPAENYLKELRMAFFPDDLAKQKYSNQRVVDKFLAHYPTATRQRATHVFAIPEALQQDLLAMSPLEWAATEAAKEALRKKPLTKITVDVDILIAKIY